VKVHLIDEGSRPDIFTKNMKATNCTSEKYGKYLLEVIFAGQKILYSFWSRFYGE